MKDNFSITNIFHSKYFFSNFFISRLFQICLTSLCDTLRLLGCFTSATKIDESDEVCVVLEEESTFHSLFSGNLLEPKFPEHIPQILCYVTLVYRLLYDVALDSYEKTSVSGNIPFKSPRHKPRQIEVSL